MFGIPSSANRKHAGKTEKENGRGPAPHALQKMNAFHDVVRISRIAHGVRRPFKQGSSWKKSKYVGKYPLPPRGAGLAEGGRKGHGSSRAGKTGMGQRRRLPPPHQLFQAVQPYTTVPGKTRLATDRPPGRCFRTPGVAISGAGTGGSVFRPERRVGHVQ